MSAICEALEIAIKREFGNCFFACVSLRCVCVCVCVCSHIYARTLRESARPGETPSVFAWKERRFVFAHNASPRSVKKWYRWSA